MTHRALSYRWLHFVRTWINSCVIEQAGHAEAYYKYQAGGSAEVFL